MGRIGLWVLAAAAGASCHRDPTQLVVWLATDFDVPRELDGFRTHVGPAGGGPSDDRDFTLLEGAEGGGVELAMLPASFGVAPRDGDAGRRVEVRVEALHGGDTLFETRAVTGFVEDRRLRLDLFLARRCLSEHEQCEQDGQTCARTGCVDPEVPAASLPPWTGEPPSPDAGSRADAGIDAGPPDAAAQQDAGLPPVEPWAVTLASVPETAWGPFVAVDGGGTAYVVASFKEQIRIGGETLQASGDPDLVVFEVGPAGEAGEHVRYGGVGSGITPSDVAWDGSDGLIVSGAYTGGPAPEFTASNMSSGFVARLSATDLSIDWVLSFAVGTASAINSVDVEPERQIWAAGSYTDGHLLGFGRRIDFDQFLLCPAPASSNIESSGTGASLLADGSFALTGGFTGEVDLGAGIEHLVGPGDRASFLARYDDNCNFQDRAMVLGDALPLQAVATESGGRLLFAGTAYGVLSVGALTTAPIGQSDVAVVALDGTLAAQSVVVHGGTGLDELAQIAALPGRPPLLAGRSTADASFVPGGDLPAVAGTADGWVAALDEDGNGLWAIAVRGQGADAATSVAWDPSSSGFYAAGTFAEQAEIDGQPVEASAQGFPIGLFLARLQPHP